MSIEATKDKHRRWLSDPAYKYGDEDWMPIPNVVSGYSFADLADAAAHDFWNQRDGWEVGGPFNLFIRDLGVIKEFTLEPEWNVSFGANEVIR